MRARSKIKTELLFKILLFTVIALVVGTVIFVFFKVRIDARTALREAKNVRMSLRSADIEMYGAGKSIYNPLKEDGLEDGAKNKASQIYESPGYYYLTSYDYSSHELTGFVYRTGRYIVTFRMEGNRVFWDVDYYINIFSYKDTE
jgi:hypothetical protein